MNFQRLLIDVGAEHGEGVDRDEVRRAEDEIGALPDDYIEFLIQVGWATFGPQEIAGLGRDLPHRWQNVVALTRQERLDGGLPEHLVAIHADGGGNFSCLDGQQVVFWLHDGPSERIHYGFTAWLTHLIGHPDFRSCR